MRFFTYILRLILICLGFIAAVFSASAFLLFLIWGGIGQGDPQTQDTLALLASVGVPVLASFIAYYAFLPALIVYIFSEIAGRRTWLFHALAGIIIALAAIVRRLDANQFANPPQGIIMAVIAAGAISGTAYWLIVGRSAGKHFDDIVSTGRSEES